MLSYLTDLSLLLQNFRPSVVDHLRSGVQDQPDQHGKTLSLLKIQKLARCSGRCPENPSFLGGWGRRITWNLGGGDCSEQRLHHCTPARAKERKKKIKILGLCYSYTYIVYIRMVHIFIILTLFFLVEPNSIHQVWWDYFPELLKKRPKKVDTISRKKKMSTEWWIKFTFWWWRLQIS